MAEKMKDFHLNSIVGITNGNTNLVLFYWVFRDMK